MKKTLTVLVSLILTVCFVFAGGSSESTKTTGTERTGRIGLSFPAEEDGDYLAALLENEGYKVDFYYADNNAEKQASQIEKIVGKGCKILIVDPVDDNLPEDTFKSAKKKGVVVISYDSLVRNTDAVSYYATYDSFLLGKAKAQSLADLIGMGTVKSTYHIELMAGDSSDEHLKYEIQGALSFFEKFYASKTLITKTKQKTFEEVAIENADPVLAQEKMEVILEAFYSEGDRLDGVYCTGDSLVDGVTKAFSKFDLPKIPEVVGSLKESPKSLANKTLEVVNAIIDGTQVPVSETLYNNGLIEVPAVLAEI